MAELKFIVDNSAIEKVKNTELKANFKEMKSELEKFAEPYKNLIVSEDGISMAKADRAKIRSVARHIDEYRKAVKKVYSEPLKKFEAHCKELTDICDEASDNIDRQVKEYERIRREEKIFMLKEYFENADNPYPEYATWEYLYDERWGNVTYPLETAHKDIDDGIKRISAEVHTIKAIRSEFELSLLDHYKQSHELISTIAYNDRLAEQKQRKIEEEQKRLERLAEIEKERKRKEALSKPAPSLLPEEYEEKAETVLNQEPEHFVATFRVYGTYEEMSALRKYMNANNIQHVFEGMSRTDKPVEVVLCG